MQLDDFEPPPSPTPDQQRNALRKGLGRTMNWARSGVLEDGPLLEACLRDLRHDSQLEDSRGEWLWRLIRAAGAVDRFRVPILHALYDLASEQDADQLCELGAGYAGSGDDAFRMRLYEIVEKKPYADSLWLGETEILRLDGEAGFRFAARARGASLSARDWDWDDEHLVNQAVERFGEARVAELLGQSPDAAARALGSGWQAHKERKEGRTTDRTHDREQHLSVDEILASAESTNPRIGSLKLRVWGRFASEAELEAILREIGPARPPTVIARLLRVFANRAVPAFAPRFIELTGHADEDVQHAAILALEPIEHPLVRGHAVGELQAGGRRARSVVGLFARNYRPRDEALILESLELPDADWERHGLLMGVLQLLEKNPEADRSAPGLVAYAHTPCESCRRDSVHLLHEANLAPAWLIEECRFDSSEETRTFAEGVGETRESEVG